MIDRSFEANFGTMPFSDTKKEFEFEEFVMEVAERVETVRKNQFDPDDIVYMYGDQKFFRAASGVRVGPIKGSVTLSDGKITVDSHDYNKCGQLLK